MYWQQTVSCSDSSQHKHQQYFISRLNVKRHLVAPIQSRLNVTKTPGCSHSKASSMAYKATFMLRLRLLKSLDQYQIPKFDCVIAQMYLKCKKYIHVVFSCFFGPQNAFSYQIKRADNLDSTFVQFSVNIHAHV